VSEQESLPASVRGLFRIFVGTLVAYVTLYGACTAWKRRGGPWDLVYSVTNGVPQLRIEHNRRFPGQAVTFAFPGETPARTDLPIAAAFSVPITNAMPFGPVLFVDTTTLPGTVVVNCFGHVIEMLPRTLFVNLKDVGWHPGTNIVLLPAAKPPPEKLKGPGQEWRGR
jgi:hypothetical protein